MEPRKLIIDADPGIGDALAILAALIDPQLDVLAVTATSGIVSARDATRNIHGLIAKFDAPKWPRVGSAPSDVEHVTSPGLETITRLNGPSGVGDLLFPDIELHRPNESPKLIADLVKQYPHAVTVLTLGPLTNVVAAMELFPGFAESVGGLVIQGGAIDGGGDATAAAETNFYLDSESAHQVLRTPTTKTLLPLEVASRVHLTMQELGELCEDSSSGRIPLVQQLLSYQFRACHEVLGMEMVPLREIAALAVIAQPELFQTEARSVTVEMEGLLTRGACVCDRRRFAAPHPNLDLVTHVDALGVVKYFRELFQE